MIWPRPLLPGGTIGICSPAGPSPIEAIRRAVDALERRGYTVVVAPHTAACHLDFDYLAGTDDERADDLNALIRDPEIDLILCARGGYGSARILDKIDFDALKANPKPLVGYSDITALSLAIASQSDVVSFSGIMATAGDGFGQTSLDPFSAASFFQTTQHNPKNAKPLTLTDDAGGWEILRGDSTVTGPIYPVCLTLLEALLATPYLPELTGAILVIEDVHEELYAVDRTLTHLRLNGVLDKLTAVLLGAFNGFEDSAKNNVLTEGVPKLVLERISSRVTVASGIPYGHIARRFTLPVGAIGTVHISTGTFTY